MESGEIYPNAPLALVAAEIRFNPALDSNLGMPVQKLLRDEIEGDWVIQNDTTQTFEAGLGPNGPQAAMTRQTISRITSRNRSRVVSVLPDRLTIEMTDYEKYADFRALVASAAKATEQILQPDGIQRLGVRYIDEVTVPEPNPDWQAWLDRSLFPPPCGDLQPARWTGTVQYDTGPQRVVVFRYGPSDGPVVTTTGHLRRPSVPTGPVFMLDFDSSWQPDDIPQFESERILASLDELREPLRGLFDSLILPDLLHHFRKEPTR